MLPGQDTTQLAHKHIIELSISNSISKKCTGMQLHDLKVTHIRAKFSPKVILNKKKFGNFQCPVSQIIRLIIRECRTQIFLIFYNFTNVTILLATHEFIVSFSPSLGDISVATDLCIDCVYAADHWDLRHFELTLLESNTYNYLESFWTS